MRRVIAGLAVGILAAGLIAGPSIAGSPNVASYTMKATCYHATGMLVFYREVTALTRSGLKQDIINAKADCTHDSIWDGEDLVLEIVKNPVDVPIP